MRSFVSVNAICLLLCACGSGGERQGAGGPANGSAAGGPAKASGAGAGDSPAASSPSSSPPAAADAAKTSAPGWALSSGANGATLAFTASGGTALRFSCPPGGKSLRLHVASLRPVPSEERMTFGSGGAAEALVADTATRGGGVSASGAVPKNLAALIGGPVSVNYGSQNSGPHPAPPADLARRFVAACRAGGAPAADEGDAGGSVSPCLMQGSARLRVAALKAVGTEPFWAASIEGRCVTYSHPEDQSGTRVWTRYTAGPGGGGTWEGALGGRPFVLRARPQPGCSDGMSDRRYPYAVSLTVNGGQRTGCAAPAGAFPGGGSSEKAPRR